jgi:hypothetical protein
MFIKAQIPWGIEYRALGLWKKSVFNSGCPRRISFFWSVAITFGIMLLSGASANAETPAFDWHGGTFNVSALQIRGRNLSADNLFTLPIRSGEAFIEATYLYQLTPWCHLQPDFQYVLRAHFSRGVSKAG